MDSPPPPSSYPRVRLVRSFDELVTTRFADGVNALCWERTLPGNFSALAAKLGAIEGIVALDERRLNRLALDPAGALARDAMLADLRRLRGRGLAPELNAIGGYPRDDAGEPVATDVYSFHADRAPVEADTYLCTYHGPASEGLRNDEAQRRVDVPATRAELRRRFGADDDEGFREFLRENCYDLHYAPLPDARPFPFGTGHLWRIALEYPGSPVPPCLHRAPATRPGETRLLLIS